MTTTPAGISPHTPTPFESVDKGIREAETLGVDYQKAGQVRQLLAERANLVGHGNIDRLVGIDQALTAMGYTGDRTIGSAGDPAPLGRTSQSDNTVRTADTADTADTAATSGTTGAGVTTSAKTASSKQS